ncbi:MAG: diguanylate cyclase (GGDEF)-like protein [Halocynthiibacter sp.]|jgi:diguanylate cyclase (GGDEF)-like protein
MNALTPERSLLGAATLDRLMPMHLVIDVDGRIQRAGPTLLKLQPDNVLIGRAFFDAFSVTKPRNIGDFAALQAYTGTRVQLSFRDRSGAELKGVIMPMAGGKELILNLSFGISVFEAVREYKLTAGDFAPTDLTIEMLYLVEAKTAVLEEFRELNQRLQGAKIAAEEQAFTDTLTGLKNRRAMDHVLSRLVTAGTGFSLMHLDLDFFKDVNDTLGHAAGDHVLQAVARVLVDETRAEDTVARVGGDEFVLIINRMTDESRLVSTARRIISKLEIPISFNGAPCKISGSIGITTTDSYDVLDLDRMLADADTALYASKHKGRACHTVFDPNVHARLAATSATG